ncbi:MAG TPA: helix-turn-helix domain-containing protein [Candidatus Phascolarctobacterium stercoravium]|nr:helix-turn-helix domain-containing protein [Candidatus Phascolarctobacterium stercoravium]
MLTTSEKIKIILNRQGITLGDLADRTNQSRQNLSNKIKRDNFSEKELRAIAAALGCECKITFILPDGESL